MDDTTVPCQVSLILATYREPKWAAYALSTLVTDLEYEVICVTPSVTPLHPNNPRVKHIYSTTRMAQCYQIGAFAAKGEVLFFIADDQTYSPRFLDAAYALYKSSNNYKTIVSPHWYELGEDFKDKRVVNGLQLPVCGMISRVFFHELEGFNSCYTHSEWDSDLYLRAIQHSGNIAYTDAQHYVEEYQLYHPRFPGQHTNKLGMARNQEDYRIYYSWVVRNGEIISGPRHIPYVITDDIFVKDQLGVQ